VKRCRVRDIAAVAGLQASTGRERERERESRGEREEWGREREAGDRLDSICVRAEVNR
jgi:hypothetical protein